jgi:hypothetical protein
MRLHYADGSHVSVYLRAGHEVPGYAGEDDVVPFAFAYNPVPAMFGDADEPMIVARLANPHPDRVLRCLDLDPLTSLRPVLLLGITLEPPIGVRVASGP